MAAVPDPMFFHYLPIRRTDEKWGLYVTGAGCARISPGGQYPSPLSHPDFYDFSWASGRTLPEFHLVLIVAGDGEFQREPGVGIRTPPGSVIMLPPGRWHRYRPSVRLGWTEYWVSFNGEIARRYADTGFIASQPTVFAPGPVDQIQSAFSRLFQRIASPAFGVPQLISADLFELLTLTVGICPQGNLFEDEPQVTAPCDQLVTDAVAVIWRQGDESITVKELVGRMLVARRTLERAFRRQLGHGVHEEILRCRLERTKRLLADPGLSLDDVALRSGFGNVRSLRRAMTAAEGMSPQAYRQLICSGPKHLSNRV